MKSALLLLTLFCASASSRSSFAQTDHDNGGGPEMEFVTMSWQVFSMLAFTHYASSLQEVFFLNLKKEDELEFLKKIYKQLKRKDWVSFVEKKDNHKVGLWVKGKWIPRVCVNKPAQKMILCSSSRWEKLDTATQYAIVYHELFGLMGMESNFEGYSNYDHSKFFLAYMQARLGIDGANRDRNNAWPNTIVDRSVSASTVEVCIYELVRQAVLDVNKNAFVNAMDVIPNTVMDFTHIMKLFFGGKVGHRFIHINFRANIVIPKYKAEVFNGVAGVEFYLEKGPKRAFKCNWVRSGDALMIQMANANSSNFRREDHSLKFSPTRSFLNMPEARPRH